MVVKSRERKREKEHEKSSQQFKYVHDLSYIRINYTTTDEGGEIKHNSLRSEKSLDKDFLCSEELISSSFK
jgi:hypothetical protein